MLIFLIENFYKSYSQVDIFFSIRYRSILSLLTTFFISIFIGPYLIIKLKKLQINQIIRIYGPKSHLAKTGTPTMGGLIILINVFISTIIWANLNNLYVWYVLFICISYGFLGLADDYYKIVKKNSNGLSPKYKYFWQSIIALLISIFIFFNHQEESLTKIVVPILKDTIIQLGMWKVFMMYLVIVSTSNAVNLTDGLDGLAIVPIIFIASGLAIISGIMSNFYFSCFFNLPYLKFAEELIIICLAIVGSGLGFLWFNSYPAQIFMGDIGSLALGGSLGMIAVLIQQELLFFIMGGLFVVETLSVILQVFFFKIKGYRIFLMAPIHHHYELKGYSESKIVIRFWIISFIFVLISLYLLKK